VLRARSERVGAEHALTDRRRAIAFAKENLALLMERRDTDFDVASEVALPPLPVAPGSPAESMVQIAMGTREDVRIAEVNTAIAERYVDVVWGQFIPVLRAQGHLTWTNAAGFGGDNVRWYLVLTADWTIFDGGFRYSELDQKRAAVAEARAKRDEILREIGNDVVMADQQIRDAQARLSQATDQVGLARESLDAAQKLFDGGLVDYMNLFDAKSSAQRAELAVLQGEVLLELARLQLLHALGIDVASR
jgi:outer membrane protein TolC